MRFSETFGITRTDADDWLDPHLSVDTKLFLDPLLLFLTEDSVWSGAHDELIAHFVHCYGLVARGGDPQSTSARVARRLLTFPEPAEFCLGYTAFGTSGLGSGDRFARQMVDGIAVAIAAGLTQPEHIEEIGILNSGIGADRISDAVCNVLKHRFIEYTQVVASRHGVPCARHRVRNAACHPAAGRWQDLDVDLPTNPTNGKPDDIVSWARRHPDRVRTWAREQTSREDLQGYDFADDPRGVANWDRETSEFAASNPIDGITQVTNQEELRQLVTYVLERFKQQSRLIGGPSKASREFRPCVIRAARHQRRGMGQRALSATSSPGTRGTAE